MAKVPQFAVPFRIDPATGVPAEVEQDSLEEIEQCTVSVLRTIAGTRMDDLDFGIPDETFRQQTPNSSAEIYVAAVEAMEPRARVLGSAQIVELATKVVELRPGVASLV